MEGKKVTNMFGLLTYSSDIETMPKCNTTNRSKLMINLVVHILQIFK